MMASETLKEFAVRLGFDVDAASWHRFADRVREATTAAAGLGAAIVAAGTAAVAESDHIAAGLQQLHFMAQRAGETVRNLQAIGFAGQTLGMGADATQSLAENLGMLIRAQPGLRGLLQGFGIDTGQGTVHALDELLRRLATMPRYVAVQYAQMFGISQGQLATMLSNLPQFIKAQREALQMQREMGVDADEAAAASNRYEQSLTGVQQRLYTLGEALEISLMPAMTEATDVANGLLAQFAIWIRDNRKLIDSRIIAFVDGFRDAVERVDWKAVKGDLVGIAHGIDAVVKAIGGWKIVGTAFAVAFVARITGVTAALGVLIKMLRFAVPGAAAVAGRALWPLLALMGAGTAAYKAFEFYKKEGGGDALKGFKRELDSLRQKFAAAGGSEQALIRGPLGLRHNNPGNLMPNGVEESFPTMAAGLDAMAKLLVKYGRAGANTIRSVISRYAPASAGNPTASYIRNVAAALGLSPDASLNLALHPERLARLMGVMIRQEQGVMPFGSAQLLSAARTAAHAGPVLNQTNNISVHGSSDPHRAADQIGQRMGRVNADLLHNFSAATY
jgi:hypothetical protein